MKFFFLSFNILIGWQLAIWNCCKPFFSLLYNCQLLRFWRLALSTAALSIAALSIATEDLPWPFSRILLLQGCLPLMKLNGCNFIGQNFSKICNSLCDVFSPQMIPFCTISWIQTKELAI
jgi:hypothetical protein